MPARDVFHNTVRVALEKDGWAITHDPLFIIIEDFPALRCLACAHH